MKANLLEETLFVLKDCGKSPKDVKWVGSKDGKYAITWKEFKKIADVEYDIGYEHQQIACDLVVVGDNWWLEWGEFNGIVGWWFKTLPTKQPGAKKFRSFAFYPSDFGRKLEEYNHF